MRKKILQTAFALTAMFSLTFCHGNSSTETNNPKDIYQSAATTQTDAEVTQSETEKETAPPKETSKATTEETTAYIPPETMSDPTYPEYKEDYESRGGLDIYFPAGLTGQCTIISADKNVYLWGTGAPEDTDKIIDTLHDLGIEKVEQIILPAISRECMGGLKDIVEQFDVEFEAYYRHGKCVLSPFGRNKYTGKSLFEPEPTEEEAQWFEEFKNINGIVIKNPKTCPHQISAGEDYSLASVSVMIGAGEYLTFLTPIGDEEGGAVEAKGYIEDYGFDYSEYAMTCMIEYGDMRILLEGDISGKTENTVLAMNQHELGGRYHEGVIYYSVSEQKKYDLSLSNIDLLITKAWDESLSKEWLDVIDPASTVVTAVKDDEQTYPQSGALSRLKDTGTSLYRPDVQGSLSLHSDGYSIAWSKDPCNDFSVGDE